jgi:phytoene/squalene synthetase
MKDTITESYELFRQLARREAKNFYYSFVFLPRERSNAMSAVYAFSAPKSFTITVADTTPPVITVPASFSVNINNATTTKMSSPMTARAGHERRGVSFRVMRPEPLDHAVE